MELCPLVREKTLVQSVVERMREKETEDQLLVVKEGRKESAEENELGVEVEGHCFRLKDDRCAS